MPISDKKIQCSHYLQTDKIKNKFKNLTYVIWKIIICRKIHTYINSLETLVDLSLVCRVLMTYLCKVRN